MSRLENKHFTNALYVSAFLHVVAISVFYLGVPTFRDNLPNEQEVFTFEVLPASAISNIKTQQQKKKGRVEKKAKEIKQSKAPTKTPPATKKEDSKTPAKKEKIETPKKIENKAKDAPAKKQPQKPKKQEVTKKSETKKIEKDTPKKEAPKKVKQQEDPIDSLLKNLEEASVGETSKSQFRAVDVSDLDDSKFSRGQMYDENSPLSVTEKIIIKRQIEANWQPPIGLEDLENMRILLYIKLKEDGSVSDLDIKNVVCPTGSAISACRVFAESVVRAVKKSNPLENLLPERYDIWKEFELHFDPSQIAQ